MTSHIMYGILKASVFWKIWRKGASNFIFGGPRIVLIRLCYSGLI